MTTVLPARTGLDEVTWAAAMLAAGEEPAGVPEGARDLAQRALAAADRQVMDDIADALDDGYEPSGEHGPRVSDAGACRRAVWYRESPPDGFEPLPEQYRRQAALGSLIHEKAAAVRAERYPWRRYEFEIRVPGLDKPARVDEYDPVLGIVTDDKTAGSRKWEVYGDEGPAPSAWDQVMIYGYALDDMGLPVRTVRVIVINRDTGAEEHFRRPYDPAAARAALDRLVELATMLDLGVVPPRDGYGPAVDWRCKLCPARAHCWNLNAAAEAGRSPESYTVLGAEPDDPTIAWAAEQVIAARAAEREGKRAKKAAEALLDGIAAGDYGDYTIRPARRDMPDYKGSFQRLLELYDLSEAHRPPVGDVTAPLVRTDRWTEVRRKRAAERAKAGGSS